MHNDTVDILSPLPMYPDISDEQIEHAIETDLVRWQTAREQAAEIIKDRGWSEKDDEYSIHVEEETRRLWQAELDREIDLFFQCHVQSEG